MIGKTVLMGGLVAVMGASIGTMAAAQGRSTQVCGQRAAIIAQLNTRFGEQVRAIGLAGQTRIVEVFASDETGTWTITITSLDGITCLMATGQNYEALPPTPPGERM